MAQTGVSGKTVFTKMYRQRMLFMMLLPSVILITTFQYLPLAGWMMAFKNYRVGHSLWNAEWVGWEQFRIFFVQSQDYAYLLRNTLVMNVGSLMLLLVSSLVFAILLNEVRVRWFAKTVQTVTFFPFFISWVIIYSLASSLFAVNSGIVNQMLVNVGVLDHGLNVLGDAKYSWTLMILMLDWKALGYNSIIFIAAIAAIPPDLYEAAEIDGAGRFGKIWNITLPYLMPTFIVILILNSGWIFSSDFEQFFLFTNSTNWEKMEVLDMYIYKYGLKLLNFSYATAVGILKTVISITLILSINQLAKKFTEKSIL